MKGALALAAVLVASGVASARPHRRGKHRSKRAHATAPAPARHATPAPAHDATPASAHDATPAPAHNATPAPAHATTPAPTRDATSGPARDATSAPARDGTPLAPATDEAHAGAASASVPATDAAAPAIAAPHGSVALADVEARATAEASPTGITATPNTSIVPELNAGPLRAKLFGSLRPTFGLAHHGEAAPRDRWTYGIAGSHVDLGLDSEVGGGVSALLYVALGTERDGTGSTKGQVDLERALVSYRPVDAFRISVGRDGVPLSAQSATPSYARVFPRKIALDDTFVVPADVGAQAAFATDKVTALAGVWNGIESDVMLEPGSTERGFLYSARVEVTPNGRFAFDEGLRPEHVHVGIGAAVTYRAATAFTMTGDVGSRSRDLRAAASVRLAYQGLFAQAEVLRRQITDDLSTRPDVATGAYAQASWRLAVRSVDVAPLARFGIAKVRQLSAPALGSTIELGAAVFPLARSSDRLQIVGLFARDVDPDLGPTEQVVTQVRLGF